MKAMKAMKKADDEEAPAMKSMKAGQLRVRARAFKGLALVELLGSVGFRVCPWSF